ncbi:MAG: hypothetical protein ACRDZZ_11030 [Ilumatobacteraceae bacterium]
MAAILVLAACGSDESVSSPTGPALQPPVVVNVAGSGGGDVTAESGSMTADDSEVAPADVDRGWMPFGGYVFETGEGLPALPANSTGYHYPAGADVDVAEVARIAAALGVAGEPQALAPETGNRWQVGPDDGTAPALFVAADGQLSWYYSNAWATTIVEGCGFVGSEGGIDGAADVDAATDPAAAPKPQPGTDPAATVPADTAPAILPDECLTPDPPAGVPTAEEAAATASELLTAIGEDPAAFELETYADEWSASVTAYITVEGVRWPAAYGFGFGEEGAMQWANGTLADPVATGPYPLVDLDAAIARLTEQNGMWGYGGVEVLPADAREAEVATADEPVSDEPVSDDVVSTLPAPTDQPAAPAEPVVVTLVDVRADLWWAWDADNSVWFLPAYTFTDSEGLAFTVPAVTDEYMIIAEPTVEPMPEPAPAEPVDPVLVDPPTTEAPVAPADLEALVGVPLAEFEDLATRFGYTTRVARQDGEDLALTMDYSPSRVNVAVEADIVVAIVSIG